MLGAAWNFADTSAGLLRCLHFKTTLILSFMLKRPFPVWERNKETGRMCSLPRAAQKVFSYPWFLAARSNLTALCLRRPHRGKNSSNCAITHTQRQKTPTERSKHSELHHSALICHSRVQSPSRGDAGGGCECGRTVVDKFRSSATHPWPDPDRNTAEHYFCFKTHFLRDVKCLKGRRCDG